jgi:mRNA-degrading endonuclease toxin of MazEF toxin-antitoxin module
MNVKTGDVIRITLPNAIGHQQGGERYAVVVSNNIGNKVSPTVEVLPGTTKRDDSTLPTHAHFKAGEIQGLPRNTTFEAESQWVINKFQIIEIVGHLSDKQLERIATAMIMATPLVLKAFESNVHKTQRFQKILNFS